MATDEQWSSKVVPYGRFRFWDIWGAKSHDSVPLVRLFHINHSPYKGGGLFD